ncbi:MAG: hypothetical protein AAGE52_01250 [Myxococcota bacterium]
MLRIESGINTTKVPLSGFFNDGSGNTEVSVASGTYCHTDLSGVLGAGRYTSLAAAVEAALNAAFASSWTVVYDSATSAYTITCSVTFSYTLTNSLGLALGFSGSDAGALSYSSDVRPYYLIVGTIGEASVVSDDREQRGRVRGSVTEDGTPYNVAPVSIAKTLDFRVPLEPHSATHKRKATASVPWTWEDFYEHDRGAEPFLASSTALGDAVLVMRPNAAQFFPRREVQDFDDYWNVDIEGFLQGRL